MLFTIAIPTYNNESTINRAIESALKQEYKGNYEVLVINNNSLDNTMNEIKKCSDDKLRVISNKETVSLFENHNVALKESKGDYVLFCHSDDKLNDNALNVLEARIKKRGYPSKYIIWGRSMFRDFYSILERNRNNLNQIIAGSDSLKLFFHGGLTPSGTCYSRKEFLKIGAFGEMVSKRTASDLTCMLKAAFYGFEFEMMDRILFFRTYASTAVGKSKSKISPELEAIEIYDKNNSKEFEQILNFYLTTLSKVTFNKNFNQMLKKHKLKNKIYYKKLIKIVLKNPLMVYRILNI